VRESPPLCDEGAAPHTRRSGAWVVPLPQLQRAPEK